jgi:uncharacterized surface protein with fasciclin (FAS1) repeats
MKRMLVLFAVAALVLAAFGGFVPANAQMGKTIAEIVVDSTKAATPEFTTLLAAVSAADEAVLKTLSDPKAELTVFAPTDAAFKALTEALGAEAFGKILADKPALTNILLFHVVAGKVMSGDVVKALEAGKGAFQAETVLGQYLDIAQDKEGKITINGAPLNMKMVDIEASNGVIHVIDAVMLPENRTIAEIVAASAGAMEGAEFKTLLTAVQAADEAVLKTLSDPEAKLTVFAPTDAAFAALQKALGDEAFGKILADKAALTNILLYHVVPGVNGSNAVKALLGDKTEVKVGTAFAKDGKAVEATISVKDGALMIDNAKIIMTNIDAANGIIHVIDAVIVPAN